MDTTPVKVFTDIPDLATLSEMVTDYKISGAQVGWSQQDDGRYHLEVAQPGQIEQSGSPFGSGRFTSPATGQALMRG